jgi:hypothetical protein
MAHKIQKWPEGFSSRDERKREEALCNRYRSIGIQAVAAAKCVDRRNGAKVERRDDAHRRDFHDRD